MRANGALAATSSAVEFAAFGVAGFLVNLLTAPIAVAIDAASFVVSAVLLGSIRKPEPPPPPAAEREPVAHEIREGLRLVLYDPVLRGLAWGTMGLAAMWGVFGATWLLFVTDDLDLDPAVIGVVAALGGFGSLFGALLSVRAVARFGLGRKDIVANVNWFMNVPVEADGRMAIVDGWSKAGDYVDLLADTDVLVAISNCPQIYNPCNGGRPTPIRLVTYKPAEGPVA